MVSLLSPEDLWKNLSEEERSLLVIDSRKVVPGSLFVALSSDPLSHLKEAQQRGAKRLICCPLVSTQGLLEESFLYTHCPKTFWALVMQDRFPKKPRFLGGVTGTNGKSSVVYGAESLWRASNKKGASLGTLGLSVDGQKQADFCMTTPDASILYPTLDSLASQNVEVLAMEVSSHALIQKRLLGLRFDAMAWTSFSQDHLDYHGDMASYLAAKILMFDQLHPEGIAWLYAGLPETVFEAAKQKKIRYKTYGTHPHAYRRIVFLSQERRDTALRVEEDGTLLWEGKIPQVASFLIENALAAIGLVEASGIAVTDLWPSLSYLSFPRGRMESIPNPLGCHIYVDYAHTPDALELVLKTLRGRTQGKLWVVFGCGGNRDASKRAPMGDIAAQWADHAVVTNDNPRHEDPRSIAKTIAQQHDFTIILDRKAAIQTAIAQLQPGDCLLVAGKGHETTQDIAGELFAFSDQEVIQSCFVLERI